MAHKHEKKVFWAIIVTETSHVFCCVLPTLFSIASLLTGFGLIATIPGWLESFHHVMHDWETTVIVFSAAVVALGWAFHWYSYKNDCHDHGCEHEPCGPRKRTASKILIAATILLVFNVTIYFGFHRPADGITITHSDLHDHGHAHHE